MLKIYMLVSVVIGGYMTARNISEISDDVKDEPLLLQIANLIGNVAALTVVWPLIVLHNMVDNASKD